MRVTFCFALTICAMASCSETPPSEGPPPVVAPDVRPTDPLSLGLGSPTTLVGGGASSSDLALIVWITEDGTVMQRNGLAAPSVAVAGLVDVKSVAIPYAVTQSGDLYRWNTTDPSQAPMKILDAVADVNADYGAFALLADGQVMDLATMQLVPEVADVVAIRASGFEQFIISGGGQYSRAQRYYLQKNGTVLLQDVVVYLSGQLPNTSETHVFALGVAEVTASGFIQSADGIVYFGEAIVHDVPARKMASTPRQASDINGSTLASSYTTFVLFDDGALWATTIGKVSGENQQGAPAFRASATQLPMRLPGDVDVVDFAVVGPRVVAFTRDGSSFIDAGDGTFTPVSFERLRR